MAKTRLARQNSSKWQKRGLLVKIPQNGKNLASKKHSSKWRERGLLFKMAQNGKNAFYS